MGRGETNAKKRKRKSEANAFANSPSNGTPEIAITMASTKESTAIFQSLKAGRDWTVSVAIPGSILDSARSPELKNTLAGQIARALSIFCVDEVIVFADGHDIRSHRHHHRTHSFSHQRDASEDIYTGTSDPNHLPILLLSYLEAPPYLRKYLFSNIHSKLESAGTLPSLDLSHHLVPHEFDYKWCTYREGVTLPGVDDNGTSVEAGLGVPVLLKEQIPKNTRVTLKFAPDVKSAFSKHETLVAEAVNPDEPRLEGGYYWGYNVRKAEHFSEVFTESPYEGGYDISIGTSAQAADIETLYSGEEEQTVKQFKHLLVVFGGESGLEKAVKNDPEFERLGVANGKDVFDRWINVLPGQASMTIKTEEAIWIGLAGLRRLVANNK